MSRSDASPRSSKSSTAFLVVLAIGGVSAICCIGTLAAVAVRNFLNFNLKARQAEVRGNLKAVFNAQRAHFLEHDTYTQSFEELGFMPARGNRYRYVLSASGELLIPERSMVDSTATWALINGTAPRLTMPLCFAAFPLRSCLSWA